MDNDQPKGYLALPAAGKGPGVLVLHAWWGLNDTLKAFCKRLADSGYVAFAPDLYGGSVTDQIGEAEGLARSLSINFESAKALVRRALEYLGKQTGDSERGLGVIGFSMGASYALDLAADGNGRVRAVVLFYGTGFADFSESRAAFLGHFAEHDPFEPQSSIEDLEEALKQAGCTVVFNQYPGTGHWFFEPDRADAYNPAAAELAWDRTLAFLDTTL